MQNYHFFKLSFQLLRRSCYALSEVSFKPKIGKSRKDFSSMFYAKPKRKYDCSKTDLMDSLIEKGPAIASPFY